MEIKFDILGWLRRRKAKKLAEERAYRDRRRPIYRGQSTLRDRMTGDAGKNLAILMKELDDHERISDRS